MIGSSPPTGEAVVTAMEVRNEQAEHYNFEVEDFHTYFVSGNEDAEPVWVHNKCLWGKNWKKKIRKHIHQMRQQHPGLPRAGRGGLEKARDLIDVRVAQGGGRATSFAGEAAIAYESGAYSIITKPDGTFWTVLGN